jgi:hypothetical protein
LYQEVLIRKPIDHIMKTLSLNIELSQLALEAAGGAILPTDLLLQARHRLNKNATQLGHFIRCQLSEQRTIGNDLSLESYDLQYEKRTLRVRFAQLQARGTWEMQGFQWVA